MLKFFRKIRYDLMSKNKSTKYFKYAIGEIVLVVIGILIALQINNWNENNKLKAQEKEILYSLRDETANNNEILKRAIKKNKLINKMSYQVLDSLDGEFLTYERQNIIATTAYNPTIFDTSVLLGILNNQNSLITQKKSLISKLRKQKFLFESIKKDLSYLDDNWNSYLSEFTINCGLDFRVDTKNGQKISLEELKDCGYTIEKLKGLISLASELRTTWIQDMELSLEHSESLLRDLSATKL